MLQENAKGLEDEIKRDFLGRKPIVIEHDDLDYIDRIGDYHQDMKEYVRKIGSLRVEEVNVFQVGALKEKAMEEKLDGAQGKLGSNCLDEPNRELRYLKKEVRSKYNSKDSSEVELLKKVAKIRCKIKPREDGNALRLSFVKETVHGKQFAALVDIGATHSFLSRKETTPFEKKAKVGRESSAFKALDSTMKAVTGNFKDTQVRVGSWSR